MAKPRSGDVVDAETGEVLEAQSTRETPQPTGTHTTHTLPTGDDRRKRYWLVVRIVDYRFQALTDDNEWEDVGDASFVTDDREAAWQRCRDNKGLLLAATGLPSARQVTALRAKSTGGEKEPF